MFPPLRPALCGLAALAASALPAHGQRFVADGVAQIARDLPFAVAALTQGDLDGDGDLDVVALGEAGGMLVLRNQDGRFDAAELPLPPGAAPLSAPLLTDVDGDGATDLIGLGAGGVVLLRGDGRGQLTALPGVVGPGVPGSGGQLGLVDVDGDGARDLLVARGNLQVLRQDPATGSFADDSVRALAGVVHAGIQAMQVADLDRDGRAELVLFKATGTTLLFSRTDPATGRRLVADPSVNLPSLGNEEVRDVAVADLDGDGRPDLALATSGGLRLLLQTAALQFSLRHISAGAPVDRLRGRGADLFGVDRRGKVVGWRNLGAGQFIPALDLPAHLPAQRDAADAGLVLGQLDGRQGDDLLFSRGGRLDLWLGSFSITRGPWLVAAGRIDGPSWPLRPHASADVDGDGDVDLVGAWTPDGAVPGMVLARNDGRGGFLLEPLGSGSLAARLAPADVDGDGDIDLFGAVGGAVGVPAPQPDLLLINDGRGRFTEVSATQMPGFAAGTNLLLPGDLDGDGDVDALLIGTRPTAYLNDGSGHFVLAPSTAFPPVTGIINFGALGDVDGDGDLDLVRVLDDPFFASQQLLLNDGAGTFTPAVRGALPVVARVNRVALADLDGDGALDIVYGGVLGDDLWLRGDGLGRFVLQPALPRASDVSRSTTAELRVADLDGDGATDLLFWRQPADPTARASLRWLRGDGRGGFVAESAAQGFAGEDGSVRAVVADFDEDGDLDVFGDRIAWRNRTRDLHLPLRARRGSAFDVELRAAPGTGVVLWWSPRGVGPPLSLGGLGTLRLDPGHALPWLTGVRTLPASGRLDDLGVTLPNDPRLIGWGLGLQAGFVPSGAGLPRLSAVVFDAVAY